MPRKTATLLATVAYETVTALSAWLITLMKRMARGAYKTICRIELMATRMAQYSLSPPARPVQIKTCASSSVSLKAPNEELGSGGGVEEE